MRCKWRSGLNPGSRSIAQERPLHVTPKRLTEKDALRDTEHVKAILQPFEHDVVPLTSLPCVVVQSQIQMPSWLATAQVQLLAVRPIAERARHA
jgi:hypothetical protein